MESFVREVAKLARVTWRYSICGLEERVSSSGAGLNEAWFFVEESIHKKLRSSFLSSL